VIALMGVVIQPVAAQHGNALQNASFDGAYTGRGNIGGGVPDGWQAWGNFQDSNHESLGVLRTSAPYSWRLRSNSDLPTGGGYQTVTATPGARYRFSIYAQIWTCDDEQFQCRDESSTWSDTASGGRVRVGIDPNGGSNPYASGVVWSSFASPMTWGSFGALSVEGTASSGQITVFTFYTADRGMRFNDVFWDDASLIALSAGDSSGSTGNSGNPGNSQPPPATAVPITNDPQQREDGALVHVVQNGQTLWGISQVYGVPIETLMALNGMSSTTIYVGQEIVVQGAPAVPTAIPTMTSAPFPTAAPVPTAIAQVATSAPLVDVDLDAPPADSTDSDDGGIGGINASARTLALVVAGLVILGAVTVTGGLAVYIGYRMFRT
jgi:hypothetical protein